MESSNPVLKGRFGNGNGRGFAAMGGTTRVAPTDTQVEDLERTFQAPAASSARTGRMTIDDVVTKTGFLFGILVLVGAVAWKANLSGGFLMVGLLGGFILAMVNTFSQNVKPALIMAYAAFEGLALGVLSHVYETIYPGIVSQAVIGTLCAFAGVLVAYRSGKIRVTPRFTRVLFGAMIGYLALGLVSFIGALFGAGNGLGLYNIQGIGLLLAVAGVGLASFFLVLDFDQIQRGVAAGMPANEAWRAGFGLMVTIVWLYLEVLRLISILRRD